MTFSLCYLCETAFQIYKAVQLLVYYTMIYQDIQGRTDTGVLYDDIPRYTRQNKDWCIIPSYTKLYEAGQRLVYYTMCLLSRMLYVACSAYQMQSIVTLHQRLIVLQAYTSRLRDFPQFVAFISRTIGLMSATLGASASLCELSFYIYLQYW